MTLSRNAASERRKARRLVVTGKATSGGLLRTGTAKSVRRSASPVLPGESLRAYRSRLKEWAGSLEPRNPVELYLVERAVKLSWQLDRADRAELARLSGSGDCVEPDSIPDDDGRSTPAAFDGSKSGERLRRYQLACGRALFRTLDAFARMHDLRAVADVAAQGTPKFAADRPGPGVSEPTVDSSVGENAPAAAEAPTKPGIAIAKGSPPDHRAGEWSTQAPGDRPGTPERAGPSSPRRTLSPRPRQNEWSGARGSSKAVAGTVDERSSPVCRSRQPSEAAPNTTDARRRVGGYAVPLDPSIPVTCADKIPVRLRREAAVARQALAAAPVSS